MLRLATTPFAPFGGQIDLDEEKRVRHQKEAHAALAAQQARDAATLAATNTARRSALKKAGSKRGTRSTILTGRLGEDDEQKSILG